MLEQTRLVFYFEFAFRPLTMLLEKFEWTKMIDLNEKKIDKFNVFYVITFPFSGLHILTSSAMS